MRYIQLIVLTMFIVFNVNAQNKIKAYEYWFDNDFANKVVTPITPVKQFSFNNNVSTIGLANGIHIINIRAVDDSMRYSSIQSQFFYKMPQHDATIKNLVAYEYWFDNDYANTINVNTPIQHQISIDKLINTPSLGNGIHTLNIRFKDNAYQWSSTLSHFFYKMPETSISNNFITNYRYWLDDDFNNVNSKQIIPPAKHLNLIDNIDLSQVAIGEHTIHFQFLDDRGLWSAVTTDITQKVITVNSLLSNFEKNVIIYPNPTNGELCVDLGSQFNDVKISITDMNEKLILHSQNNNGQIFNINLNTYQSGVYFITIMTKKNSATYRLIKN